MLANNQVYRSSNAGISFTLIYTLNNSDAWDGDRNFRDIEIKPGDSNVIYISSDSEHSAAGGAVICKTVNARASTPIWGLITPPISDPSEVHRIAIAVSANDPNCLFASIRHGSTFYIFKSFNSGSTWTEYLKRTNLSNYYGSKFGGVGFWRNEIEISPTDTGVIYVGGYDVDKITNQGNSVDHLYNANYWAHCHVDVRFMKIIKGSTFGSGGINDVIFVCNDGGISKTSNGSTMTNINGTGLAITQSWGIGISNLKHDLICSGLQDDNVFVYTNGNWYRGTGGDGGKTAVDRNDPKRLYANTWSDPEDPVIRRSLDGGHSWGYLTNKIGVRYHNRDLMVHNNNTLYTANHDLFKYNEVTSEWVKLSDLTSQCSFPSNIALKTFTVAPSNPNYTYATTGTPVWDNPLVGKLFKGTNVESTPVWTDITPNCSMFQSHYVYSIEVDPDNPNRVWLAGSSGSVNYSSNGGASWVDISTGLPNLNVNKLVYQNGSDDLIYAGTDGGVYYYDKPSLTWKPFNSGLPNCVVQSMAIDYYNGLLVAATYGRGFWVSPLENNEYKEFPMVLSKSVTWDESYSFAADITIPYGKTLTITQDFTISKYAKITVQAGGVLNLNNADILSSDGNKSLGIIVEAGGWLKLNNTNISSSNITVKSGGTISLAQNVSIEEEMSIDVFNDGYICFNNTSGLNLDKFNSVINLQNGYNLGANTLYVSNPGSWNGTLSSISYSGSGSINTFTQDVYIQNQTFSTDTYITGKNIYVGKNVTASQTQGDVLILNGTTVIFNATENVILDKGFEAETGGVFEVK